MGCEQDGLQTGTLQEVVPNFPQIDKGAEINLLKAAASAEEAIRHCLDSSQRCEVNGLDVAASPKEVAAHLSQIDNGTQINLTKSAAVAEEGVRQHHNSTDIGGGTDQCGE